MRRGRHRSGNARRPKSTAREYFDLLTLPTARGQTAKNKAKNKHRSKAEGKSPAVRADKPRRGAAAARPLRSSGQAASALGRADGGSANEPPVAVAAHIDRAGRVVIDYSDGSSELREGGTLSWRDNNPGNMRPGSFTSTAGAIGENRNQNGRYAIFPDGSTGGQAMRNRLTSPDWAEKTLQDAINTWAPAGDGNDSGRYGAFVSRAANVPLDTRLDSLSADQLDNVTDAMKRYEGWRPGQSTKVYPP
jgi:hypothetical protein